MTRIAFDTDGVLLDFCALYLAQFHNPKYGTSFTPDNIWTHDLWAVFSISREQFYQDVAEFFSLPFADQLPPIREAVSGVRRLLPKYQCLVLTSRPAQFSAVTRRNLDHYFPGYFKGVYHADYAVNGDAVVCKGSICRDLDVNILIEDHIAYARDAKRQGVAAIVLEQPWNKNYPLPAGVESATWQTLDTVVRQVLQHTRPS